jgi:hypothetical protein
MSKDDFLVDSDDEEEELMSTFNITRAYSIIEEKATS